MLDFCSFVKKKSNYILFCVHLIFAISALLCCRGIGSNTNESYLLEKQILPPIDSISSCHIYKYYFSNLEVLRKVNLLWVDYKTVTNYNTAQGHSLVHINHKCWENIGLGFWDNT